MNVEEYIESLPIKKQERVNAIRCSIKNVLPKQIEEVFTAGSLIRYELPLSKYPKTYNKKPLMYLDLASRSNYETITLTAVFNDKMALELLRNELSAIDSEISLKSPCVKLKRLSKDELNIICKAIKIVTCKKFVSNYESLVQ